MSITKFEEAIKVEDQDAADLIFERMIWECMGENGGMDREEAIATLKDNLGYFAGYYDNDTRARVEKLYRCAHPVFGPIATVKPPTPDEALQLGRLSGEKGKIVTLAEFRKGKT